MIGTAAKPLHHAAAHHAPAERAHDFPEFHAIRIGMTAGCLISRKQILARTETADRFINLAKAPGIDADPAEILHRVAEMRELPVQHRAPAVGADDQIAWAETARS